MPRRSLLTAALLALTITTLAGPAHGYWLKIRRQGTEAIIAAARSALVAEVQWWRYELDVLEEDPSAGLAIEVSRKPIKKGGSDVSVRVRDKKGGLLAALAVVDGKATVWIAGKKASSNPKDLFTPVPRLGVPLALWAAFEFMPSYRVKFEGEFQGTALMRMTPDYTAERGLVPMKLGISKRNLLPTVVEVVDLKGRPSARLLWIKPKKRGGRTMPSAIRLRTLKSKNPLDFRLVRYTSGKKAPARFGKKALSRK